MYEDIHYLITKCCINHKLHAITQDQLFNPRPVSTTIFTQEDITYNDVLDWLFVRFPESEVHLALQSADSRLLDCLTRHLDFPYRDDHYRINKVHLILPEGAETVPTHARISYYNKHHHDLQGLLLINSPKGYVTLNGMFPTTFARLSLSSMNYSNSQTHYDQALRMLRFLAPNI